MAKIAHSASHGRRIDVEHVPNASGLLLCMAVAVPIWAAILALLF